MGRPRMIWSKAAREKVEEELDVYLEAVLFILRFENPSDVAKVASDNIRTVMKELEAIISSKSPSSSSSSVPPKKDDVSLIISEYRSKVENQLQYIRDNDVSRNNNKAFHDFILHFKYKLQHPVALSYDNGTTKKKRKVLTQLELQQQKDDLEKRNVCLDKQDAVSQFTTDFYDKTLQFMEKFIPDPRGPPQEDTLLIDAFVRIGNDYHYLFSVHGYSEMDKWYHLDVPQLIEEYKLKLETELQQICDKVSDPAIKEAFSHHLTDVTAQNKDKKRMSSKQNTSVIQSKILSRKELREIYSLKCRPTRREFGNHNQSCFKVHSNFYRHHVKSPPKAEE